MQLEFAKEVANAFIGQIQPFCSRVEIAGSVRRGKREVKDVEICAIPRDLFELKTFMDKQRCLRGKFPSKYSQIIYSDEKIDIYLCSKDNWGNIFLIRTGDWEFSKWIMGVKTRQVGLRQRDGYLWRGNERLSCPEERDFFSRLGMAYIEPRDRNGEHYKKS